VHVRVAPSNGGPRLNLVRRHRFHRDLPLLLVLSACSLTGACHRPAQARNLTFEWSLSPARAVVGPAVLELRVLDAARRPVHGARLRVEAQMSHPGMAPVVAGATEGADGTYSANLQFTMAGDWILLVAGSLSNGETVQYRIDVPGVRSAS
jgi:YtkA-like